MPKDERAQLARMCRSQAALASTDQVRTTLVALAEIYEKDGLEPLVADAQEGQRKRPE